MNRKLVFFSVLTIAVLLVFAYACKKDSSSSTPAVVDNTLVSAVSVEKNAVIAVSTFESINNFAQAGFISSSNKAASLPFGSCPTLIVNFTTPPYSITLDWGTECTGIDGVKRTGKIDVSLNGMMTIANNVATMKIENYVSDNKKITGTVKITSAGPNPGNGWPRYDFTSEGKIEFADKSIISFKYDGVTLQQEGTTTPTVLADDVWRTEVHSASGINQDGTTWTAKSVGAMIKKGDCKWYNSGIYEITPSKGDKITIDFGNGTCDNKAKMTKGSVTTEITLD
jgi:hypothetical protein